MNRKSVFQVTLAICAIIMVPSAILQIASMGDASVCRPIDPDQANAFLTTIAQVLGGVLAIVFSVSALAVAISSDRYTPRQFRRFASDRNTIFVFALVTLLIVTAVVAIALRWPMCRSGLAFSVAYFVMCFVALAFYVQHILSLLDPRNVAESVLQKGLDAIRKREFAGVNDAIGDLGDVAVKTFELGEENTSREYSAKLHELVTGMLREQDFDELQMNQFESLAIEQHYRVFQLALSRNRDATASKAIALLGETVREHASNERDVDGFKSLLGWHLTFLEASTETSVKHGANCRAQLARQLIDLIFPDPYMSPSTFFCETYLVPTLRTVLELCRMIREWQDYDLWEVIVEHTPSMARLDADLRQIAVSYTGPFPLAPKQQDSVEDEALRLLYYLGGEPLAAITDAIRTRHSDRRQLLKWFWEFVPSEWHKEDLPTGHFRTEYLRGVEAIFRYIVASDDYELWQWAIDRFPHYPPIIDLYQRLQGEMMQLSGPASRQLSELAGMKPRVNNGIRVIVDQLLQHTDADAATTDRVMTTLDQIEVDTQLIDAFFKVCAYALGSKRERYVLYLWQKSNELAGFRLTHFDLGFLTYPWLKFYVWRNEFLPDYDRKELAQYYLLCIARSLRPHPSRSWLRPIPFLKEQLEGDTDLGNALRDEIRSLYRFQANLGAHFQEVLAEYDAVMTVADTWNAVLWGDAALALQRAKSWLESNDQQRIEQNLAEIVTAVPLDHDKIAQYAQWLTEDLSKRSKVDLLSTVSEGGETRDIEPEVLRVPKLYDRAKFTFLENYPDTTEISFDMAARETDILISTILACDGLTPIPVMRLSSSDVLSKALEMHEHGHRPNVLMLSPERHRETVFGDRDRHFRPDLDIAPNDKVALVAIPEVGDKAVLFDKASVRWQTLDRFEVSVEECDRNPLHVHVIGQQRVFCEVIDPTAICVWELGVS